MNTSFRYKETILALPKHVTLLSNHWILLTLGVLGVLWTYSRKPKPRLPLPPGPKPLPVIGNLLDMPNDKQWLVYDQWFKQYGDIVHINVLGQPMIILGTASRALDLFEKRSSLYSDRIRLPMMNELMGWHFNFAFMRYGSWWRRHRRLFHEYYHPNAILKYRPIQVKQARAFLRRLLVNPDQFMQLVRHAFSATIMDIAYGIQILDSNDPYITTAEESMDSLSQAGVPGSFLVDLIPILKYVPAWVPGVSFKRKAAHWAEVNTQLINRPFDLVKEALAQGTAVPSVAASMLEGLPDDETRAEEEIIALNCVGISYAAGADTTISSVQSFFMAMATHPEAQKKAQAELDAVIGHDRLPDFDDFDSLPYIQATVKETMRWQNVVPLAVAHACTADDEYDGYFIPKGAIVMGNAWTMLHDPKMYPNPDEFRPDRFLKDGKINPAIRDPHVAAFGFGRRICPGRHLSDNSLYSIIASVVAVYNISPPVDDQGHDIQLTPEMTSGLLSYPVPFKCIIKPRSSAAEALIRESDLIEPVQRVHEVHEPTCPSMYSTCNVSGVIPGFQGLRKPRIIIICHSKFKVIYGLSNSPKLPSYFFPSGP